MGWLSQIFGFFRAFQCWLTIAPWEQALRVRLGKTSTRLGPGVHWRIPFIDRIFVQAVRLRTISDSGQTMTTRDGQVLTLGLAVSYAIADIRKLYETVSNPESTLLLQVQGHVAQIIASSDRGELSPAMIEGRVSDVMPSTAWGLCDVRLIVTTFAYVKCYRLLNYEYRSLSAANELDTPKVG